MSRKSIYSLILLLAFTPLLAFAQSNDAPAASTPAAPGAPAFQIPPRKAATVRPPVMPSAPAPRPTLPSFPAAPGAVPALPAAPARAAMPIPAQPPINPAAAAALPAAQTVDAADNDAKATYQYNFMGTPLTQILDEYATLVNRTILQATIGPTAVPNDPTKNTITLKTKCALTREEAIRALEAVLGMNGITMVNVGDKFVKVVPEAVAAAQGGKPTTDIPEMGKFITTVTQWKYASPEDIKSVLQPFAKSAGQNNIMAIPSTQTLVLRDYAENVKRMLEMVEQIDVQTPLEIKPRVVPIKYALAADIQQVLGSLGSGGGGVVVGSRTGSGAFGSAGTSAMRTGTTGLNGTTATGAFNNGATGANGLASGLAAGGAGNRSTFQNNLARAIGRAGGLSGGDFQILGQTKIIADERTNALLVFANDDDMKMIQMIIDKLDVVLAQVLIESIIMEVTLGNNRDIGISYLQHKQDFGSSSFTVGGINNAKGAGAIYDAASAAGTNGGLSGLPGGLSYLTSINKDLDVVLQAVQGDNRVNVLSRPRIQTSHAVPANLFVGDTVPYITGNIYGGYSGNSASYSQLQVGISLDVLPLINPDGLVVMDIQQNIEQIGGYVNIQGAGEVPKTTKRQANAKVAVHDGETIMLGGFISNSKSTTRSGVPWLMDIPFLGSLFRSNSDKHDKVELIVLIRPTVLPTPAAAAAFASEERDKMSGVKKAEMDLREEERKANEKIEAEMRKNAAKKAKKAKNAAKDAMNDGAAVEPVPNWDADRTPTQQGAPVPNNEK